MYSISRIGFPAVCLLLLAAVAAGPSLADNDTGDQPSRSTPAEQTSLGLTIYNSNLGLVKDVRRLSLPTGVHSLWFEGVAASIDPTSVHIRSLDAPNDLEVLEQNFEYDLISPQKLMEKYLGLTVELVRRKPTKDGYEEETIKAKLLGIESGYVYEIDGKIAISPAGSVVLPSLPKGLISKPSLVWLLESGRKQHTVEASYLTSGINWKANYVAVLAENDKKVDLSGWVTIDNKSGVTYKNASLKLVAGDVNRVRPEIHPVRAAVMFEADGKAGRQAFREEAFFEYHLYTLNRKATVKNNQTKQIGLLSAENIDVVKSFIYAPTANYYFSRMGGPDKSTKVGVFLSLENSKKNNMGMPLPKGIVRVYKKDRDGALQFVGEDRIDHTPEDETVRIKMGDAFDVVAERVQTDFKMLSSGHLYESSYKVTIRNHKEEDIVVSVVERLSGDWTILDSSSPYEKESSHRVRFDIPVESKSSNMLVYSVRIKY